MWCLWGVHLTSSGEAAELDGVACGIRPVSHELGDRMSDTGAEASWELLEYASIHDVEPGDGSVDISEIIATVDWDLLAARSLRQRLMPRLTDFLIRSGHMAAAPKAVRRVLVHSLNANRFNCESTAREANRVVTALRERGLAVACTKGVVFQVSLYDGFGGRYFGDIDLMIHEDDKRTVAEILPTLGYQANLAHDYTTNTIVSRSSRELMMYRMYPDHLPHFVRPVSEHVTPLYEVDVCFNITWYGAAWQIPTREVLAELETVEVRAGDDIVHLPSLTGPYNFVFTAMHLFRETWFERNIETETIRFGQFADLWRLWHRLDASAVEALAALIDRHHAAAPIAWACYHVDEIYGSRIVSGLGLDDYCDKSWLYSARALNGSYLSWGGSMRERVRSGRPPVLTSSDEPRFAAQARVSLR